MSLPLHAALLATLVAALVIFATRLFPFALFSKREPPPLRVLWKNTSLL